MAKHSECAEAWRDQTGKHQNVGSVYYRGDTIYSYGRHFPMARLVPVAGVVVVFVTTDGYSGSTSAHLSVVREAVKAMTRFDVPKVLAKTPEEHATNLKAMYADARERDTKAEKARTNGDWHRRAAKEKREMAYRYAQLFGIIGHVDAD